MRFTFICGRHVKLHARCHHAHLLAFGWVNHSADINALLLLAIERIRGHDHR